MAKDLVAWLQAEADVARTLFMQAAQEIETLRADKAAITQTASKYVHEAERLTLQWTGMKDEVNLCHAKIERLKAELLRLNAG